MIIKVPMKYVRTQTNVQPRQQTTREIRVIKRADIEKAREMVPEVHPEPQALMAPPRMGLMITKLGALALLGGSLCD